MGFVHVLELRVEEVHAKLSYWVVDRFDPRSCELILSTDTRLHIEPDDVWRVFGFLRGKLPIVKDPKCSLLVEWMNLFGGAKAKIGQADILKKMMAVDDDGVWFKWHFIVLVMSSLV